MFWFFPLAFAFASVESALSVDVLRFRAGCELKMGQEQEVS
jgi:hypothetical protein